MRGGIPSTVNRARKRRPGTPYARGYTRPSNRNHPYVGENPVCTGVYR